MATIKARKGIKGTTYRVEAMRRGARFSKSFKTKAEAQRFASLLNVDDKFADTVFYRNKSDLTVKQAVDGYLKQHQGKDPSASQRMKAWEQILGASRFISKVSRNDVKSALDKMDADGLSAGTINRYKSQLSAMFTWLADEHGVEDNPARMVRQRKEDNSYTRFLSEDEAQSLLAACRASRWDRLYLLVLAALVSGGRRSELLNLRWSDVDFTRKRAFLETTKNGKPRQLQFTDEVMTELSKFREVGNGYIFVNHAVNPGAPWRNFDQCWRDAKEAAGIADIKFHGLRHTAASWLAMSGLGVQSVANILGHSSLATTKRYSHLCDSFEHEAVNRTFGSLGVAL